MVRRRTTGSVSKAKGERRKAQRRARVQKIKIRISLLPGILTTANVLCGFYAVIWAMKGRFFAAAVAIIVAAGIDALDGRVARLTKTTSEFGVEFDSMADVVSFGVAPAVLSYCWVLGSLGRIGWIIAFAYLICGVLRLARFNTRCKTVEPKFFLGLPTPAAGLFVATSVTLADGESIGTFAKVLFFLLFAGVSYLMISNVKYRSFKQLDFAKMHPFGTLVAIVGIVIVIASSPGIVPFFLIVGYLIWGLIETFVLKKRAHREALEEDEGL